MPERSYRVLFWVLALTGLAADQATKYGVFSWLADVPRNSHFVFGAEARYHGNDCSGSERERPNLPRRDDDCNECRAGPCAAPHVGRGWTSGLGHEPGR